MWESNQYPTPLNCAASSPARSKPPPRRAKEEKLPRSDSGYHYTVKDHTVDIDHDSWIKTVTQKLNEVAPISKPSRRPCTIFRFMEQLHEEKEYSPIVVSIGPYHNYAMKYGTMQAMQDHKWQYVRRLLSRHRNRDCASRLLDKCLMDLQALDGEVRSCYSESLYHLDDQDLASMMFVDGCFIIWLLLKQVEHERVEEEEEEEECRNPVKGKAKAESEEVELEMGKGEEEIEGPLIGMQWIWNLVVFDLLKLENQIPFFVIRTIYDTIKTPSDGKFDLVTLALGLFQDIRPKKSKAFKTMPESQIHHLLHLFHSSLITRNRKSPAPMTTSEWIPSAANLKRSGINFVKKKAADCCLDVSFDDGRIEIPPLELYDYSRLLYQNLIAFEQCFGDVIGKYFTNYAKFMECVINSKDDAKLLISEGIVANRIGTDEVAADIFKRRNDHVQYASDENYLAEVFTKANKYHGSKWRRWRARLIHDDDFCSPWKGFAILVMVLLLLLVAGGVIFSCFKSP